MALTKIEVSVVNNYRRMYREKFKHECSLTDEKIWQVRNDWYFCEPDKGKTIDDHIVEDMYDG